MIDVFDPSDRLASLDDIVSSHGVPMVRSVALIFFDAQKQGATVSVASAIRVDSVLEEHNKRFHTNLHGQQYLYDHQNDPGFNPANPPKLTSHCWFSDGNPAYRTAAGVHIPAGGKLPRYGHGTDVDDIGKIENNSHLLLVSTNRGFHFARPYVSGSEIHHLVLVIDPTMALVDLGLHLRTLAPSIHPGKDIEHAQRMLQHLGYLGKAHPVGQKYGQQAQAAIKKFKRGHDLPSSDATFGVKGWKALETANAKKLKEK